MDKKLKNETLPYDHELDVKVKKCMERISENIHISANEPSLAVYRLQEHVRRALPPTVARRQNVLQLHSQLQGACYDVEYALGAVHGMSESSAKLTSIQDMLKDSLFYRNQVKYEQTRRKKEPSMYKRLSSHLTSIDIPDFHDIPDALRETASRVESALQHARSSYESHSSKKNKPKDIVAEEIEDCKDISNVKEEKNNALQVDTNEKIQRDDKVTEGKSTKTNETKETVRKSRHKLRKDKLSRKSVSSDSSSSSLDLT